MPKAWSDDFLELALEYGALRFGEFTLKSGRVSPYFFNAGQFNDGAGIDRLARCYAACIMASGVEFDGLFGPAYKGIPLATAVAISLQRDFNRNVPYSFDRKEAKDHGEGGIIVGAPLSGRILIIDDVISAGTSVRASCELIEAQGATAAGVAIALDRQEKGQDQRSAVDAVRASGLAVINVSSLSDLIDWLDQRLPSQSENPLLGDQLEAIRHYRDQYGV